MKKQKIAILGSTGSIGSQTLDVVDSYPEMFEVYAISAGENVEKLISQAKKYLPEIVVIANQNKYEELKEALRDLPIKVFAGEKSIADMVTFSTIDVVVTAMVGYSGLIPTIKAIESGKKIALANKETLVVAGELVSELAGKNGVSIIPVDSEHNAIFQCLVGENLDSVEKIILTASGGPFRNKEYSDLQKVTASQALEHPTWKMGAKITIDSATMMNKGFEVIEAKWLFGLPVDKIDVVVHPQSIVHSMVQFCDGSIKAQLGSPDMRHPIQYALTFPRRIDSKIERVSLPEISMLTFEKPNHKLFKNIELAYYAMKQAGNMPCVLNASNEVVVEAFLSGRIGFLQMSEVIEKMLLNTPFIKSPSLEDYILCDKEVRTTTLEEIQKLT